MALRAPRETEPFDQTLANMKHGRQRELLFSNGNDCISKKKRPLLLVSVIYELVKRLEIGTHKPFRDRAK